MARRRPRQLDLPVPPTWGGRRPGAGRKPNARQAGVWHIRRPHDDHGHPVLVTLRGDRRLPSLRGGGDVSQAPTSPGVIQSSELSRRSLLGSDRSHPSRGRGRRTQGAHERNPGFGRAVRPSDQPRLEAPRARLERPVPPPSPADAARDAGGDCLRAAELSEAPSRARRDRPPQLGPVVRWLGTDIRTDDRTHAGEPAPELARQGGLAAGRRTHPFRGSSRRAQERPRANVGARSVPS